MKKCDKKDRLSGDDFFYLDLVFSENPCFTGRTRVDRHMRRVPAGFDKSPDSV